jgi:RNA polymerase sigma-70 factor (ECF subfamily)
MSTAIVPNISGEALEREFEEIFREHYQLVYRTAYAVTGNRQDAEDVLQTIFLRLLQRKFPPDLKVRPEPYLYRAAVNVSLNIVRTRKRHKLTDGVEELEIPVRETGPGAEEEIQQRLVDAIAQLSPQVVEILILRYEHDYSDAEIAKMLGTSRGSIAVTLYRARARVKKLMRELSGDR